MGRRRRKVIRIPKKKIPSIFLCPKCGRQAIRVQMFKEKELAVIKCGSCGLTSELNIKEPFTEVDAYCEFTDRFYADSER